MKFHCLNWNWNCIQNNNLWNFDRNKLGKWRMRIELIVLWQFDTFLTPWIVPWNLLFNQFFSIDILKIIISYSVPFWTRDEFVRIDKNQKCIKMNRRSIIRFNQQFYFSQNRLSVFRGDFLGNRLINNLLFMQISNMSKALQIPRSINVSKCMPFLLFTKYFGKWFILV